MTRQPKTPRTFGHDLDVVMRQAMGAEPRRWGYRRRKKGRRAKSGQWWRRIPPIDVVEPWPPTAQVDCIDESIPRAKTLAEYRMQADVFGVASIHIDDAVADYMRTNA